VNELKLDKYLLLFLNDNPSTIPDCHILTIEEYFKEIENILKGKVMIIAIT